MTKELNQSMSDEPRKFHLNALAADELRKQRDRAGDILETLAAHLAATEPDREDPELVAEKHVRRAAELLFCSETARNTTELPKRCVFVSFSHEDQPFVGNLIEQLDREGVTHFTANRDIQAAADWSEVIWDAIGSCHVFLLIMTPRFKESRWSDLESGAACGSKKKVLTALRYVERNELLPPLDRFQSMVVENNEQLNALVDTLKCLCQEQ